MAGVTKKQVSVSAELHLLMDAARGVHALTRQWIESYGLDADLPHGISALLTVLVERLRLLDRVVRGTVDPRHLACAENDVSRSGDPNETDLLLDAWSEKQLSRHHRAEWRRARARLQSRRAGGGSP